MPSLIDFRRRIRSVKNTQQITKAMKMVAAAKLRRAQDRVIAARPYGNSLRTMLENVAAAIRRENVEDPHPLLAVRPEERVLLLVITSDRGLAGAFSMNVIKEAIGVMKARPAAKFELVVVGRKIRDYARRRDYQVIGEHVGIVEKASFADAQRIAKDIIERYANAEIDAVYVVGNEFKSVMSQQIQMSRILPLTVGEDESTREYLIEGEPLELLKSLLPRYVEAIVLRVLLESAAAEHAARMTAMEAATNNAADVIDRLTLHMNRVRQASITKEIIEVVSGAGAAQ